MDLDGRRHWHGVGDHGDCLEYRIDEHARSRGDLHCDRGRDLPHSANPGGLFRGEPRVYDAGLDPAECDCLRHRIRPTAEHAESRGVLEYHWGRARMADPQAPVSADGVRMKDSRRGLRSNDR